MTHPRARDDRDHLLATLGVVRIALHSSSEVGTRAGRILLGDRRLEVLGLVDKDPTSRDDARLTRARDLSGYDVIVTDSDDPDGIVARSVSTGTSCVVWVEPDLDDVEIPHATVVLTGANLASGIAPCLASHEVARASSVSRIVVAWTEPGSQLRSGEPLAFPDPVGGLWGRPHGPNAFVAPLSGEWAGAMATVTTGKDRNAVTRIVGVADLAPHLEAIALAAGTLAVATGAYAPGLRQPPDAAEAFLAEALGVGLDVAASTLTDG